MNSLFEKNVIWDFWYQFDDSLKIFHVFFLNAPRKLFSENKHHLSAKVGYATTIDFVDFNIVTLEALTASDAEWDNTAIWSGDVVTASDCYAMFYTSRNKYIDDGMTQRIGLALSVNRSSWVRVPLVIDPMQPFATTTILGDISIHAWRDPFLCVRKGVSQLLVSAKLNNAPIGHNGCIAVLEAVSDNWLTWAPVSVITDKEYPLNEVPKNLHSAYSECEVPQLFVNENEEEVIVFSSWSRFDKSSFSDKQGGLHAICLKNSQGYVLLPESSGLYACRPIPELGGEIVGFDIARGGLRRSGVQCPLRTVNRCFSMKPLTGFFP